MASGTCPHRGAALDQGTLQDGCLRCPYHGLYFGADGRSDQGPDLLTYLTTEAHGLLWTCLSGDPAYDLPAWPELEDTTTRKQMRLPAMEWNCSVSRQVENFQDVAHLSWLHTGTFGNRERPELPA
ncbi:MAG: Rieske 2Fe-2S domain-containing protein [Candidatus Synoicihabitans palmerolidicus]|nr:Rieske 2Fe-2S domain-containing protein [Candidatus Synoicihabitans palmerolidicus]